MTDDEFDSFEQRMRMLAREVGRSIERVTQVDLDQLANTAGVDRARASELVDGAIGWLRDRAEHYDISAWASTDQEQGRRGPHPLDHPSDEQGLALAALDSGRWTAEPGSHVLVHGEGPGPRDAVGLVGELRARDWIAADGAVTIAGRHALTRWLDGGRQD